MRRPGVLGVPAYRAYLASVTVNRLGSAVATLAVTFAVLRLGASATQLGVVLGCSAVPALLLMLVGGVAGDRWDRRAILIASDAAMALTQGTLALLLLSGRAIRTTGVARA